MKLKLGAACFLAMLLFLACDDHSKDIHGDHDEYEAIEHGCLHMMDAGVAQDVNASIPGPHMDEEDFEHTKLNLSLVDVDGGKGGYLHFGPDITGDMYLLFSADVPVSLTNRTTSGDTELEIEETFTAAQIEANADCTLIKKALVFEAKEGGNIIFIGPTTFETVSLIIEEGSHSHEH